MHKIPGEYGHVAAASADPDALRHAHATPCTPDEAKDMLRTLCEAHGVTGLRLLWGSKRGRGGLRPRRVRVLTHSYTRSDGTVRNYYKLRRAQTADGGWVPAQPYISLPRVPSPEYGKVEVRVPFTRKRRGLVQSGVRSQMALRVGLVLHEFAHVLMLGRGDHGRDFVSKLDALVAWWADSTGYTTRRMES